MQPLPVAKESPVLNLATMVMHTEAEGPGERFALWVQGCTIRCSGCCNPQFFSDRPNKLRTVGQVWEQVLQARRRWPGIEGVSLLGGEPTEQSAALAVLAARCKEAGLTVMLYTGRLLEDLQKEGDPLLPHVDLVLDGPYVQELRTTAIRWAGCSNQRFHFLTGAYRPDDPRFQQPNTCEVKLVDGEVLVVGFPFESVTSRFRRHAGEGTSTPD